LTAGRGVRAPLLLLAGYALLLAAWVVANPPFAAPDEANHYLRAIGISQGELVGERSGYEDAGLNAKQSAFSRQTATQVAVPPGLAPDNYGCNADRPTESAACQLGVTSPREEVLRSTAVGTYLPLPYLLPAAVMRAGDDPAAADRWGRFAGALLFLAFLAAATFALWDPNRGPVSLLGLVAAVTPMVVFCGSILNGSGLEIASAIAFTAALLRLSRDDRAPRLLWPLLAVSGSALALSRPVGPQWIVIAAALAVALAGRRQMLRRVRAAGIAAYAALAAILVATVLNRVWEGIHGAGYHVGLNPFPDSLTTITRGSKRIVPELIGNFGVLDTRLPTVAWLTGYLLIGILLVLALRLGSTRERRVVVGATAFAVLLPGLEQWLLYRHTGYWIQGRYFLPILMAAPLLYGEIVLRHAESLAPALRRRLPPLFLAVAAALQLGGWWVNSRRYAVGTDGPAWFLGEAEWSPPSGWTVWAVAALAGAVAIALAAHHRPGGAGASAAA
jgi:hypothetical protein